MKRIFLSMPILVMVTMIALFSCNKEEVDETIYLGDQHNKILDFNYNRSNYFESTSYEKLYEKTITNTIDYVDLNKKINIVARKEIEKNITHLIESYFVFNGEFIFNKKKKQLINDLKSYYNEEEMDYLLKVDALLLKSNKDIFKEISKINKEIKSSKTLSSKEKNRLLNVISVVPHSLNYWGNNIIGWQSSFRNNSLQTNYNKNIPDNIIPPVPNCPPGYCWSRGVWHQELHMVTETDFWGAAGAIGYTWWMQGTPVGWGTAVGGAAVSSITYVLVWVLKGGTGCQPC